jgi:RelA/SpoT family (p)ppGpp synthetase
MVGTGKLQRMLDDLLRNARENIQNIDEEKIKKAFEASYEAHKNHFRASGDPYFYHPYEVAMILARELPIDDISIIAALLHDVLEDTSFPPEIIEKEFGKETLEIVNGVTKISGITKTHEYAQADNYRKLVLSMIKDIRVILVKFADRLHNMRTLEYIKPEKQIRIAKETVEIFAPLAHRFGLGQIKWELEDLAFKYLNREAYNELAQKINAKRKERENYLKKFIEPLEQKLKEHKIKCEIEGRAKHLYSIYKKMIQRNKPFEEIYDLFAVRIIIDSEDKNECYYVLGIVYSIYTPLLDRLKDYIVIPKTNNYQSLHTTVIGPEGKFVEVQIRLRKMHEIAEKGVAAHWKYKEGKFKSDPTIENWINNVREILEGALKSDQGKEFIQSFKKDLAIDEIYVFSPKGDIFRLPVNSTPVDFAFEVHSNVGYQCIGAKVNGKIVPLDTKLNSGDQVEIITSKNHKPNPNWLMFVQTNKAKTAIRRYLNKQDERVIEEGKELVEKKLKKLKLNFSQEELLKLARNYKCDNLNQFYKNIAQGELDLEKVFQPRKEEENVETEIPLKVESVVQYSRSSTEGILIDGDLNKTLYSFAKCCNPIPGDQIVGFVTIGEGIKIHRKNCLELIRLAKNGKDRLMPVAWNITNGHYFISGITIVGEDMPGLLKEISSAISSYESTNIKSVNIATNAGMFKGIITMEVKDLEHLQKIIERLKKIKGIYTVERFDGAIQ